MGIAAMTSFTTRNKANRLSQIVALLSTAPDGMSQAELARRLGVNRSTVNRYIPDLPGFIYIDELEGGKWKLDHSAVEFNIQLTLHEAMAIHLATRLLTTRMERQNPHSASALRKLSLALERISPQISSHLQKTANSIDDPARVQDPCYLKAVETLTQAWATYHKVMIHYLSENDAAHTYLFSPYFIEPYAIGQSTYVVGWREPPGALRTFKIERITDISLCGETYTIPPSFDPDHFLKDAWGIWFTEEAPVMVQLRFSARAARRVKETRWHRSERVAEEPDGSLIWTGWIAEPTEMLPWIKGWGAEVEVLAPAKIRTQLYEEAKKMLELYENRHE